MITQPIKSKLEHAVINCNYILSKWMESRPALLNYEAVRGMFLHQLKRAMFESLTDWRDRRRLFRDKILYLDIDVKDGYLKKVLLCNKGSDSLSGDAESFQAILTTLNYEDLAQQAKTKKEPYYSEVRQISFNTLQQINF